MVPAWGKPPRPKGMPVMFKSTSTSLILLGVLAIITGAVALAWPGVTILALVILFAVYAFIGAGTAGHAGVQQRHRRTGLRPPAARADRPGRRGDRAGVARGHRAGARADRGDLDVHGRRRRVVRRLPQRGGRGYPRAVHRGRPGVHRVRHRAVLPA